MEQVRRRQTVAQPPKQGRAEHPVDEDDDQLMARFVRGDDRAFMVLVERHQQGVSTYVLHILGPRVARDLAADVTQDVFARVVARAADYEASGRFAAWLYTIARNRCFDVLGSARLRHERPLRDVVAVPIDTGPRPDASLRHTQLEESLDAAMTALTPRQSQVFALHRAGLSHSDAAAVLDLTVGAVKYHVHQARVRLRAELAEFLNP
jgi:RNA polymerase sigma-70 factor, ECF subfamily